MSETAVCCLCHTLAMETVTIETERHPVCLQVSNSLFRRVRTLHLLRKEDPKCPQIFLYLPLFTLWGEPVSVQLQPHKSPYLADVARDIVLGRTPMHFNEYTSFNLSLAKQSKRNAKAILKTYELTVY